ncbi:hypothetical protein BCL57_003312 [Agromyces flavus]|uniref:Uncharacterized protein n=1 Tax=Agromyces flavus TaxID=589382 RepID=A0A1H1NA03_9MICO|nr:hypothetical protein [Agromyces flavus]MCP2369129.1 hypothetical protein [Agromyces flavus]GGI48609.1 hypothetical protein GCM10010932_32970 [Agromyces flavus]SDR95738.1 hypothetical protein SAMN04489721_0559 [Agromyces flavus]
MDLRLARSVLRLDAALPLTAEMIEQAYAHEAWERHPSRYPEGEARQAAETWAGTLAEARSSLLGTISAAPADGPFAPAPRRSLPAGAIIGIVAGGLALIAMLVVGGVFAVGLVSDLTASNGPAPTAGQPQESEGATAAPSDPDVDRVEAWETAFTFPAALEFYSDGRYGHLCGVQYAEGCWESALFTEADCAELEIELGFANNPKALSPERSSTVTESDVVAFDTVPVVFGDDDFDYGWIEDVRCTSK